jgi:hypothetical protein
VSNHDTSGVRVPPPLFYVAGFLVGVALEFALPIDGLSLTLALAGALVAGGLWLALDGAAMLFFRRAGTSMVPFNPTTALVTTGVSLQPEPDVPRHGVPLHRAGLGVRGDLGPDRAALCHRCRRPAGDRLQEGYLVRKFGHPY